MMVGSTRKHAKARRRAVTKLINSTSCKKAEEDGTSKGGGQTASVSDKDSKPPLPVKTNANSLASIIAARSNWKCEMKSLSKERVPFATRLGNDEPTVSTTTSGECVVCGVLSKSSCAACNKVFYCGKGHQKKHWNEGHKFVCFPCQEMSPEEQKGRVGPLGKGPFMKASRDLHPMEKIYEDYPLMTGPGCCADLQYEPVCLGCTKPVKSFQKCSLCQWPLCGAKCEKDTIHALYECEIFATNGVQELKESFQYELVRILRCLLTKQKAPEIFEQLLALDGALAQRKTLECLIEANKTIRLFIRDNCKLVEFDDETISHMGGVVDLHTQASGKNRSSMQIFSFPSKLLHACDANTRFVEVLQPNGENLLQVIALRPIKKGEPLTQRLLINLEPTYERQKFLKEHYYFRCKCTLCTDPTENGTYFSAVKCPVCYDERESSANENECYVLPISPTNIDSPWACNNCRTEFSSKLMLAKLDACENSYWKFKYGILVEMAEEEKIAAIRQNIIELEKEFHPNNFSVWKLKQLLFNKLTEQMLVVPPSNWKRFLGMYSEIEQLARFVKATVNKLQPGFTLIRGRSLHDLIACYWGFIQWSVLYGKAASFKLHPDADEFYKLIEEAVMIFEPEVTDIRRVIDSVVFMRDHVHEVQLKMQKLKRFAKLNAKTKNKK